MKANCKPILPPRVVLASARGEERIRSEKMSLGGTVVASRTSADLGLMITLVLSSVVTAGGKCLLNPPAWQMSGAVRHCRTFTYAQIFLAQK